MKKCAAAVWMLLSFLGTARAQDGDGAYERWDAYVTIEAAAGALAHSRDGSWELGPVVEGLPVHVRVVQALARAEGAAGEDEEGAVRVGDQESAQDERGDDDGGEDGEPPSQGPPTSVLFHGQPPRAAGVIAARAEA